MTLSNINPKKAAATGNPPTLNVAIEQSFPIEERLIVDELAPKLFKGMDKLWIKWSRYKGVRNWIVNIKQKYFSGGWTGFIVRKRYIDERLLEAVHQNEVTQAVNLGVGLDTRFYRFKELNTIKLWELDQAVNVNYKRKIITKAMHGFPQSVNLLSIDFTEDKVEDVLTRSGYSENQPTFYIMEAVSQYLDEAAMRANLEVFSKGAKGSKLAFTYVPKDFITGENKYGEDLMYKLTVKAGVWGLGYLPSEIPGLLQEYGYQLIEDLDYSKLDEKYVTPTGRDLSAMKIERMVFAEKI